MDNEQQRAVLTICLMAALVDGGNDDRERAELKRVAEGLSPGAAVDVAAIYQQVLLTKPDLPVLAGALTTPEQKKFAYEMAVGICNADGVTSPKEREFLAGLAQVLGLDAGAAQQVTQHAEAGRSPSRRARSM